MIASSPADFRKEAEGYVRQADVLPSGTRRFRLLDMAGSCIRLAEQTEWLSDAVVTLQGSHENGRREGAHEKPGEAFAVGILPQEPKVPSAADLNGDQLDERINKLAAELGIGLALLDGDSKEGDTQFRPGRYSNLFEGSATNRGLSSGHPASNYHRCTSVMMARVDRLKGD